MAWLHKLLSVAGSSLCDPGTPIHESIYNGHGCLGQELLNMLKIRNGFYAFESALHVFPSSFPSSEGELSLEDWNSPSLWRYEYADLAIDRLFFAQDAFGNQFCLNNGCVCAFDAETGAVESIGKTLEEWAERILVDYEFLTGYPLLHHWQRSYGALPVGTRLMPKIPFVLGGAYDVLNLYALNTVSAMKARGNLARQIQTLPDGSKIEFKIIE